MGARAKFLVLLCVLIAGHSALAQQIVVSADKPEGVYDVGDTVRWTVEWQGDSDAPGARYVLKRDGLTEVGKGDLRFDGKRATLEIQPFGRLSKTDRAAIAEEGLRLLAFTDGDDLSHGVRWLTAS